MMHDILTTPEALSDFQPSDARAPSVQRDTVDSQSAEWVPVRRDLTREQAVK